MINKKITQVLLEQLKEFKVENVYGYAGDTIIPLLSALKDSELNLYTTRHEAAAGLMASAEAKLTGELAVCLAHSGPGTANIINGIADAAKDRAPVLLITGQVPSYNIGTDYKQYVKQLELTDPLTVYSETVTHPESIVDLLFKAATMAIAKGGVSQLVIPMDLWEKETSAQIRKYPKHLQQKDKPNLEKLESATKLINKAKKPVILYGRGALDSKDELIQLSQRIGAALINTLPAAGLIDNKQDNVIGGLGQAGRPEAAKLINEADLIIIVGASWWPMDYVPRQPKVIQIDLEEENIALQHPVEVGIVGDAKETLQELLKLSKTEINFTWQKRIKEERRKMREDLKQEKVKANPLLPDEIMKTISKVIGENEIITLDTGDHVVWFGQYFNNQCQKLLVSGSWRTMGFGIPAALAAKINQPEASVTAIIGDGGFSMFPFEILTAQDYQLPIRIIVLNNGSLAMERNKMIVSDYQVEGTELNNPDFAQLAELNDFKGIKVNNRNKLREVLKTTQDVDYPVLLDVDTAMIIPEGTKL